MARVHRRSLLIAAGAFPATLLGAEVAQKSTVRRIGYLASDFASNLRLFEAFVQGLRELGRVEGRDLVIERRDAKGQLDRLPALAAELVASKVDVIVAASRTLAALAAQRATETLPTVVIAVADPVASGLVASLARPGGNVTGLSALSSELTGKWLELLKQAVPTIDRIALLLQPGAFGARTEQDIVKQAEVAARALGLRLQLVQARGPAEIERAFVHMAAARAGAFAVPSTPLFSKERTRLLDLAAKNRLPAMFTFRDYADAGGLMSYGPNLADLCRRAATYVDKILKGAKPGDLPVEQPTKFELVINLQTAKELSLTISQTVLARADDLIQ